MKPSIASQPLILTSGASGRVTALFSHRALRSLLLLFNSFLLLILLLLPFRRRAVSSPPPAGDEKREVSAGKKGGAVVVRLPWKMVARRPRDQEVAARRAMAIRRLGLKEEGDENVSVRDFSIFPTARGDTLFTQSWTPVAVQTK